MANFRPSKQTFCCHYRRKEVGLLLPIEHQLMDETGKSRSEIHKEAIKHWYNSRQQQKLQLV